MPYIFINVHIQKRPRYLLPTRLPFKSISLLDTEFEDPVGVRLEIACTFYHCPKIFIPIWETRQKASSFRLTFSSHSDHIKRLRLDLFPTLWEVFRLHLDLPRLCRSQSAHNLLTICKNLKYVRVRIFYQILEILLVHSIQFFIFISKI